MVADAPSPASLGLYCLGCMPGYHLPFFASAAPGDIFREHGFEMELVNPPTSGGVEGVLRTARGETDFCITSVGYYLMARAQVPALAARFINVIGQRSPMAGLVSADSLYRTPEDLGGRRVGAMPGDHLAAEFMAAMSVRDVESPVLVPVPYTDAPAALARDQIDVVADFADLVPRARRWSGIAMRAVSVGLPHYANGIVAGDHIADEQVQAMNAAVSAALLRQRGDPMVGLPELLLRCPGVNPADALEGWSIAENSIFADDGPRGMNESRWQATIGHAAVVHDVSKPPTESIYRMISRTGLSGP